MLKNRLGGALSPYLRQHADNPAHWQPWDREALDAAARADRPILLSIGYAACHWCHVMAHESFEDPETAAMMNELFVNIKVDREERPDLDRVYQAAHYVFVRRAGGWPLTMFLTPEGEPFFGGTYFPRREGRGLPSFQSVMQKVSQAWREQRDAIRRQNDSVLPMLRSLDDFAPVADIGGESVAEARRLFGGIIDREHGGFRGAPKFPHPSEMMFCLESAWAAGDDDLLEAVRLSLEKMAAGGLQDHLGGGFFRYCVDDRWAIPHFEKMLCDNGLLLALFADGARAFKSRELESAAEGIADWAAATMRCKSGEMRGAFYSSLDADSEGGEGAFYVWEKNELESGMSEAESAALAAHFGLHAGANFEGRFHLARRQTVAQTAAALKMSESECEKTLAAAKKVLLKKRRARKPPATDDKILTAWNALLIFGLARAGRVLGRPEWIAMAAEGLRVVADKMTRDGRFLAARRGRQSGGFAFLDDCAFLLEAALELLRADFRMEFLDVARRAAEQMTQYFEDDKDGGFFFTAADGEKLIRRPKAMDDNAVPSGNGAAARSLPLLSWLCGEEKWEDAAARSLRAFGGAMQKQPAGCASLLSALRLRLSPPSVVLLVGDSKVCRQWREALERNYSPELLIYVLPPDATSLPPPLQKTPPAKGARAYVCNRFSCKPPADSLADLQKLLAE